MNPNTVTLALQLAALAAKLVIDIKQQSGLTDDQLLELADVTDEATNKNIKAFLESLPR